MGSMSSTKGARLGYVYDLVVNIADDPMTQNIQNGTGCNDTIIRESLTGPSIPIISNVDNILHRLKRAMKETGRGDGG